MTSKKRTEPEKEVIDLATCIDCCMDCNKPFVLACNGEPTLCMSCCANCDNGSPCKNGPRKPKRHVACKAAKPVKTEEELVEEEFRKCHKETTPVICAKCDATAAEDEDEEDFIICPQCPNWMCKDCMVLCPLCDDRDCSIEICGVDCFLCEDCTKKLIDLQREGKLAFLDQYKSRE
jgi:hypothetical protein